MDTSKYMWVQVDTDGYNWIKADTGGGRCTVGCRRIQMDTNKCIWAQVDTDGYKWIEVDTVGNRWWEGYSCGQTERIPGLGVKMCPKPNLNISH